jgi:RimJ/RimL family protein N-acetyltransferase
VRLEKYEYRHNAELFEVAKLSEPWHKYHRAQFDAAFAAREGFVLVANDGALAGCIMVSDYFPGVDAMVHCTVAPEYHTRWLTKSIYKEVFDFVFVTLDLHRCGGYVIDGMTPQGFHERLGFKQVGIMRQLITIEGEKHDLILYDMLKEERRW